MAKSKQNLQIHIKSKHENVRFHSEECVFAASSKQYLKQHVQAKHENVIAVFIVSTRQQPNEALEFTHKQNMKMKMSCTAVILQCLSDDMLTC